MTETSTTPNQAQQQIEHLRKKAGMRIEDIAVVVQVSIYTVSRWKTGKFHPHATFAKRLTALATSKGWTAG